MPPGSRCAPSFIPLRSPRRSPQSLPYRLTGQLNVTFGNTAYFGTATYIRRYTGVTAGHLLYDPQGGLATSPYLALGMFAGQSTHDLGVGSFAVLSGYQAAANIDPDANAGLRLRHGLRAVHQPGAERRMGGFRPRPPAR